LSNGSENLFAVRTNQAILRRVAACFRGSTALCREAPLAIVRARLPPAAVCAQTVATYPFLSSETRMAHVGLDADTLQMLLGTLATYAKRRLPTSYLLKLDEEDTCPLEVIRELLGPDVGLHLVFIPEEYGGLGGGAHDVFRVSEAMATIDLGVATAFLAIFLGTDPIVVGATDDQRAYWMRRIAEEGLIVAYAVTEPLAGSEVSAIRTRAERVVEDGAVKGYRINGTKQFISNGGIAQLFTVLASTDKGPCFFAVEAGTPGLTAEKHENKHGIRSSNTTPVSFDNVYVSADNLIGKEEGKGLAQAQAVFGFTRLMVAAFGLGGGVAAVKRALRYARQRIQAGTPLAEKQAFMHKLIVPHVIRLEAARAYITEIAARIDAGTEPDLTTEGAIAKLWATEAGNAAADASIQAHGGYGYTREYEVEKIRRDVRITTIYEGTSEIMQWTIGRDRWRVHLQSRGEYYRSMAAGLEGLHRESPDVGAHAAALAARIVYEATERARIGRLTRHQHVLFRLGEMMMDAEVAATFCRYAAGRGNPRFAPLFGPAALKEMSRVAARQAALDVATEAIRWIGGCEADGTGEVTGDLDRAFRLADVHAAQRGLVSDMDVVARAIVEQDAALE
jgi:alkylation response protein AidB-like acyl-CoA dehydrogenase